MWGQTPQVCTPGWRTAQEHPRRPRGRSASGDARSRREGDGEAQPVEGGGAARVTPGLARRVLAPGNVSLVLSPCSGAATTNSYSFRNADLLCIRWDYIYIFFVYLGFWFFVFAKIAKF